VSRLGVGEGPGPLRCRALSPRPAYRHDPALVDRAPVRSSVIGPPGARLAIASSSRSASSASTGPTSPRVRGARRSTCTRPLWVAQPLRAKPESRVGGQPRGASRIRYRFRDEATACQAGRGSVSRVEIEDRQRGSSDELQLAASARRPARNKATGRPPPAPSADPALLMWAHPLPMTAVGPRPGRESRRR